MFRSIKTFLNASKLGYFSFEKKDLPIVFELGILKMSLKISFLELWCIFHLIVDIAYPW